MEIITYIYRGRPRYIRNENRKLMALDFLPVDHVQDVFDSIAETVSEHFEDLVLYIKGTCHWSSSKG